MHKYQSDWSIACAALNDALRQYKDTPTSLARLSGVDYYAIRRFLKSGVKNKNNNALLLCAVFGIEVNKSAKPHSETLVALQRLLEDVWDGSQGHAALLTQLIESTQPYIVKKRNTNA